MFSAWLFRSSFFLFALRCAFFVVGFLVFQARPQIPRRDGTIGPPPLGYRVQPFDVRDRAKVVGPLDGLHNTKIARWKDIGTREPEDQQHLDGPTPNPLYFREFSDDLIVAHAREICRVYRAVLHLGAQIPQVAELLTAQPGTAERRV